jgi:hypothetical protein
MLYNIIIIANMTTLYYWRVWCTTDSAYKYTWAEEEPTTCPENIAHSVDSSKTTILDIVDPGVVKIQEENTPTGGNFKTETRKMSVTANSTDTADYTFDIPIAVYSIYFITTSDHEGDELKLAIAPDTTIGVITSDVNSAETEISVNSTVTDNTEVGFNVKITDGTNTDDLGRVLAIDKTNGTITVQTATTNSFLAATPTYIQQTLCRVENYEIGPPWEYSIGASKIGGSYVPANTVVRVIYTNNGNTDIDIVFRLEYTF